MARRFRRRSGRRAPLRKFVWARSFGFLASDVPENGVDLLGNFQSEYGAQLLGATVVRVRGFIAPGQTPGGVTGTVAGTFGLIVDKDTTNYQEPTLAMEQREHDDWMAYIPWSVHGIENVGSDVATGNMQGNQWGVDIKSSRKIEELGQTLQLWRSTPATASLPGMEWHLSIGLKLP